MLYVVDEGIGSAFTHMERDRNMLAQGFSSPRLSFYEWDAFCVTYGLFSQPENVLNLDACKEEKIEVAQRPTGGGIFFHEGDVPFSLFLPNSHVFQDSSFEAFWAKIQESVISALNPSFEGQCEESPPSIVGRFCQVDAQGCDFVWKGKKFGGAAFRKSKQGILCQATFFCHALPWEKVGLALKDKNVLNVMKQISPPPGVLKDVREVITKAIMENL